MMRGFIYGPLLLVLFLFSNSAFAKPKPEAFGVLPAVHDAAISPDAKRLAVIINFDDQYGVNVLSIAKSGQKPRLILLGKTAKPKWVKWVNNDRVLVAVWRSEKILGVPLASSYIVTIDAKTMKSKFLIVPRDMVRQFNDQVIDFLDDDPKHILMSFSNTVQTSPDIQRVDVKSGKTRRIKRGRSYIQNWYTDRRGEPRIGQGRNDKLDVNIT